MNGVCITCGRPFETDFTLPTDECDDCFQAQYDAAPTAFVGPDIRQTERDEQAASDAFTDALARHYEIERVDG